MLVKYIGSKKLATLWLPIGEQSHGAWERNGSKVAKFTPGSSVELPDADAMKLVRKDPNFQLVTHEADIVEPDVHGGLVEHEDSAIAANAPLDGTEFAQAIEAEPVKKHRRQKKA